MSCFKSIWHASSETMNGSLTHTWWIKAKLHGMTWGHGFLHTSLLYIMLWSVLGGRWVFHFIWFSILKKNLDLKRFKVQILLSSTHLQAFHNHCSLVHNLAKCLNHASKLPKNGRSLEAKLWIHFRLSFTITHGKAKVRGSILHAKRRYLIQ